MSVELLNIDCMEYMRAVPDKFFDLAIVDPPYGIGVDKDFGKSAGQIKGGKTGFCQARRTAFHYTDWDRSPPAPEYFAELERVSKNRIIWGANHMGNMPPSPCWLVWDKNTNGYFADAELAYTSFKTAVRKFEFTWNGLLQGDMKDKEQRIHPTQKPRQLYRWLLQQYAKPGQRILDTHLGSGSSAIAAHYFGCDFVGCEIDPDYFKAARERFDRETRQQAMAI